MGLSIYFTIIGLVWKLSWKR